MINLLIQRVTLDTAPPLEAQKRLIYHLKAWNPYVINLIGCKVFMRLEKILENFQNLEPEIKKTKKERKEQEIKKKQRTKKEKKIQKGQIREKSSLRKHD